LHELLEDKAAGRPSNVAAIRRPSVHAPRRASEGWCEKIALPVPGPLPQIGSLAKTAIRRASSSVSRLLTERRCGSSSYLKKYDDGYKNPHDFVIFK
jgi:hypothetical protein